jgi:tetratricopeptide (TPR) repeat protein
MLEEAIKLMEEKKKKEAQEKFLEVLRADVSNLSKMIAASNLFSIYFSEKNYLLAEIFGELAVLYHRNKKCLFNMGVFYLHKGENKKAIIFLKEALLFDENYLKAIINLGVALKREERLEEAKKVFEKGMSLDVYDRDLYYNYANLLINLQESDKARRLLLKNLRKDKNDYKSLYSLGLIYQKNCNYEKSLYYFDKVIKIEKEDADAHFAKGLALLGMGEYEEGWREYRYRWEAKNELKPPDYKIKWWNGENLFNKKVLLQQEQGFGDNIQFSRYIFPLKKKGAKIYWAIKDELYTLFKNSLSEANFVRDKEIVDGVDFFISLMDLPRLLFEPSNPFVVTQPYLYAKENSKKFLIPKNGRFKVAFCWQGNRKHRGDKNRSIDIKYFAKLFEIEDIDFYSLQFEEEEKEKIIAFQKNYTNLYDYTCCLKDFNDTANFLERIDLVIAIDSALAHLCGAIGKKCWLLLHECSEWRWLRNSSDTQWYKSIEIFRNKGNWENFFDSLKNNLKKQIN